MPRTNYRRSPFLGPTRSRLDVQQNKVLNILGLIHETNQVRDILCRNCNCALGLLQDDVLILESALAYLKKWKSNAITF